MIDFIDGVLEPSLWFLADWSLRWALLVAVLAGWLVVARPRRSATRYLLCLLGLLAGLVLPAMPRWGVGFTMRLAQAAPIGRMPASEEHETRGDPQPSSLEIAPAHVDRDSAVSLGEPVELKPIGEPLGLRRIAVLSFAGSWTLVAGLLFARGVGGWVLLEGMRRTAVRVQGAPADVFQDCRRQLALRRQATLATHPAVHSPLTLGLHRPMILVPPAWPDLSVQAQRGSLLHELAHLARYDDWLALVMELVRVVFFFHPLLHWLIGRIEYERELLCDETAIAHGIDPREYAGVLLEFSRQTGRLRPAMTGPSYPLGFGHRRTVKARIQRLLEGNMNHWMSPLPVRRAIALGTVALALGLFLGSIRVRALETETEPGPAQATSRDAVPEAGDEGARAPSSALRQEPGQGGDTIYRIKPFHVLKIDRSYAEPAHGASSQTVTGNYLVEPDGKVDIGSRYGKVMVSGLTLEDAEDAVRDLLKKTGTSQPKVSVSLAGWVTKWLDDPGMKAPYHIKPLHLLKMKVAGADPAHPLGGNFLIEPSGKINLGPGYGRVAVAGLTLEEAQDAVEKHLKKLNLQAPKVSLTLAGWESDWHDLMKQGARRTDRARPTPGSRTESLRYGDKTFAEWRATLMSDLKPEVRVEAIKALSAFGANGYGKEAAEAIIQLMRGYESPGHDQDDDKVINAADSAFRKLGPEGISALIKELKQGNLNGRRFAISALKKVGPTVTIASENGHPPTVVHVIPKAAVPAVLEAFKDEDPYVRVRALSSMNTAGVEPKRLIPALAEALKDPDLDVRLSAIYKLTEMGQSAKPAMPALLAVLKDDDEDVRYRALGAMLKIGANLPEALPGIIMAFKDQKHSHTQIFRYLEGLGPEAKEAVPALIAAFGANPGERWEIARVLGNIGPAAKDARPTLIDFLEQNKAKRMATNADDAVREALRKISK